MKRLSLLIVIILFIGVLPSLLQYSSFMQLKDFSTQHVPFILEIKRMILSGSPWWSWNTFIGSDFMSSFAWAGWTSPFVWFNFLFPDEYVNYSITIVLFLKMLCMGWLSFLYFEKMFKDKNLSTVGALMYVFSSFSISTIGYFIFLDSMILFPLVLLGAEKVLRKEKFGSLLLILGAFLSAFMCYYMLPGIIICSVIYISCRFFARDIQFSYKQLVFCGLFVLLGIMIALFVILPLSYFMDGNERIAMSLDLSYGRLLEKLRTMIMPKLLEQHNPMLGPISGWTSNATNIPVIGPLLAIVYIIRRNDWIRLLLVITLLFYLTPLNGLFSLFTNPEYSRWVYCLTFFLIIASLKFVSDNEKITHKNLLTYLITSFFIIIVSYINGWRYGEIIMPSDIFDNVLIISVYVVSVFLLVYFVRKQNKRTLLMMIILHSVIYVPLVIFMSTDMYHSLAGVSNNSVRIDKKGYANIYIINNHYPRKNSNEFHFRTEFVTRGKNIYQNMPSLKNVASVNSYNTASYHKVKRFLSIADTTVNNGFFAPNINTNSFDALTSVKEIVVFEDSLRLGEPRTYEGAIQCKGEGYIVYENPFYVPMGFTYDYYMNESLIDSLNAQTPKPDIPLLLLSRLAVKSEDEACVSKYLKKKEDLINEKLDSVAYERKLDACSSFVGNTSGFKATIDNPRDNYVFFSVPYDKGFTAFVDNNKTDIMEVNMGLSAVFVPKGKHQIEFSYMPRGLKMGAVVSLIAFLIACVIIRRDMRAKEQVVNTN